MLLSTGGVLTMISYLCVHNDCFRDIVYSPIDLNSIKKNIESGHIKTTEVIEC